MAHCCPWALALPSLMKAAHYTLLHSEDDRTCYAIVLLSPQKLSLPQTCILSDTSVPYKTVLTADENNSIILIDFMGRRFLEIFTPPFLLIFSDSHYFNL